MKFPFNKTYDDVFGKLSLDEYHSRDNFMRIIDEEWIHNGPGSATHEYMSRLKAVHAFIKSHYKCQKCKDWFERGSECGDFNCGSCE